MCMFAVHHSPPPPRVQLRITYICTYVRTYIPQSKSLEVLELSDVQRQFGDLVVLEVQTSETGTMAQLVWYHLDRILSQIQHLKVD